MRLVADANILFSLVKQGTSASLLVYSFNLKLFSPLFAFDELFKYRKEIEAKSEKGFEEIKKLLKDKVFFVNHFNFSHLFKKYKGFIDEKDIPYLALAEYLNVPIWSNDSHLKKQSSICVYNTEELIHALL